MKHLQERDAHWKLSLTNGLATIWVRPTRITGYKYCSSAVVNFYLMKTVWLDT